MIVTTTPTIEGQEVQRYCGIVFAKVIWWGSIGQTLRELFSREKRIKRMELELQHAEEIALHDLQQKAEALGANAVLGVTFRVEAGGAGPMALAMMATATGTAVVVTPKP